MKSDQILVSDGFYNQIKMSILQNKESPWQDHET